MTNIISVSIKGTLTDTDSDFTKKDEKQNNDRNIYLHDKIIEKIYRNFEINTVFVNNKQY